MVFMTMFRRPLVEAAAYNINKHVCTCCCTRRSIQTSPSCAFAARSPTVERKERLEKGFAGEGLLRLSARQHNHLLNSMPPHELFESAHHSGTLGMGVDEAIQVLYTFLGLGTNPTQKQVQKLCNSYSIKAKNLTLIARVQLRATTVGQQEVAQNLLLAACSLMDHEATFRIVSQAVKQQLLKHHAFQPAMRNLEALAKDKHPQALTLKGQIAMSRGEEAEGLKFLEEATRNTTKITDTGYDVGGPREGWLALGRWKLKREKYTEAKAAFRVAADMDDPVACHYLANLPDTSSEDQHVYLLRAAASGSAQAAHELGLIYLERAKAPSTGKFPTSSKERADWRNTAQEWFNVANFGGHIPSVLELAEMSGEIGLHKVGLELLKTAESFDDVQPYSRLIEEVRHRLSQGSARSQSI